MDAAPAVALTQTEPVAPYPPAPPPARPQPAPAPAASGGFILRGVLIRGSGGAAIIEAGDGRQRLVRAGGVVAPGIILDELTPGSVALLSGGTRQTLLLDGDRPAGPQPESRGNVRAVAATANDYRLGMKPVREGDRVIGHEIVDMTRLPIFRLAGLRSGDVVTAIGGQGLESQEKLLELPAEIAGSNSVSIDYRRGGVAATATVEVAR
ncbi:type II secretion system protein N [Sandarakinorhabdus sp. DWP1-3-1]|uniref:type II secretion system protein N n=1 Tax=Sandarakinorhabdus sp. DWP1-3-1 TaxID=2804627 RepID=UPI003CEEB1D4